MRIFVTGATGRVGSRLVPRLIERGDTVRILTRQPEKAEHFQKQGVQVVSGNLLQPDTLTPAVDGIDAVIHLAAFFRSPDAAQIRAINSDGTRALAQAARQAGVSRFVLASTNLVYGAGGERPLHEDDTPQPTGAYPESKFATEQELLALQQESDFGLRIVRLAFVYGEGDPHLREGLQWFRTWNPNQRFHMVHHADVDQAMMLAVDAPTENGRVYNVADDIPVAISEVLEFFNEPIDASATDRPLNEQWGQIVDTTRIKQEWGFCPMYPSFASARADAVL